jgi:hypothetical protein
MPESGPASVVALARPERSLRRPGAMPAASPDDAGGDSPARAVGIPHRPAGRRWIWALAAGSMMVILCVALRRRTTAR